MELDVITPLFWHLIKAKRFKRGNWKLPTRRCQMDSRRFVRDRKDADVIHLSHAALGRIEYKPLTHVCFNPLQGGGLWCVMHWFQSLRFNSLQGRRTITHER
jgi:hypothetical protein